MLDFGVTNDPYWMELKTKGHADRFRSFCVFSLTWDRLEFNDWGVAQGPALKLPFMKIRFWLMRRWPWQVEER